MHTDEEQTTRHSSQPNREVKAPPPPQPLSDLYIRFINLINALSKKPF